MNSFIQHGLPTREPAPGPELHGRWLLAVTAASGVLGALIVVLADWLSPGANDFDQLLVAARALLGGENPYDHVGPGRTYDRQWGLYYPLPAVLLAVPFSLFADGVGRALFVGSTSAALGYGLARAGAHRLALFLSAAYIYAAGLGQWSIALTAAVLLPWLGFVFAAKPTIGAALWSSSPRVLPLAAAAIISLVSLAIWPRWPAHWLVVVREGGHFVAPILLPGGWLVVLALLKWKRAEARLLFLLACVPQTLTLYEVLPLFLATRTLREAVLLALLTNMSMAVIHHAGEGFSTQDEFFRMSSQVIVLLVYLPVLAMVLRRPNVWSGFGNETSRHG